ncbi:alkaline phosphatase family protein [Lysobacter cavernae]|uniref:Alkaline phosphatase family protein n=1 Tax=Lysobacter cavernae TaxID=1685901 RepID=A0ABV7RRF7_9GAMM
MAACKLLSRSWIAICLLAVSSLATAAVKPEPRNVVLVTLDGVRVQEMFGGLDVAVLQSALGKDRRVEDHDLYRRYWAATPEARRAKLMPFFWNTLMQQSGSIAGNPARGSRVQVSNRMRISYPGYAELLTGQARDADVTSNRKLRIPFPTVAEFVRRELALQPAQVATFASWETFDWIAEHTDGNTYVNAGFAPYPGNDPLIRQLDALQLQARAWPGERFDVFTQRFALAHLQRHRPRYLHIAYGNTDEWAHAGDYPATLQALALVDGYLQELWTWLQSQPQYRDRTTLVITTDHGRGNTPAEWANHNHDVEGAQNIWLAIVSPDDARRGEWHAAPTLQQNQVAATVAAALGLDYARQDPAAGQPIALQPPSR